MIVERFAAHVETPAVIDLLYRILQCEETTPAAGIVDVSATRVPMPRNLAFPLVLTRYIPVPRSKWLADRDLALLLVDLLSPVHSTDIHNNTSELLKAVIALSAPSPATLNQGADPHAPGFEGAKGAGGAVGVVNNRIVRELAGEDVIRRMVSFMLDADELRVDSSEQEEADAIKAASESLAAAQTTEEEEAPRPLNPRDSPASEHKSLRLPNQSSDAAGGSSGGGGSSSSSKASAAASRKPRAPVIPMTPQSRSSSLVTCIGIIIELIRKNNSDYFEQHLFHTLRLYLLQRQQEIAEQRLTKLALAPPDGAGSAGKRSLEEEEEAEKTESVSSKGSVVDEKGTAAAAKHHDDETDETDEENEMEGMEEAMAEVAEKLGIVHLGPMLSLLSARLPDFQKLLEAPREHYGTIDTSLGGIQPLTFERYRITELYAELLHCSNMALLNRPPGSGPQYSKKGTLLGGIDGLQTLARALQGQDGEATTDDGQGQNGEMPDQSEGHDPFNAEDAQPASASSTSTVTPDSPDVPPHRISHTRETSKAGTTDSEGRSMDEINSDGMLSPSGTEKGQDPMDASLVASGPASNEQDPDATIDPSSAAAAATAETSSHDVGEGALLKKSFLSAGVVPTVLVSVSLSLFWPLRRFSCQQQGWS